MTMEDIRPHIDPSLLRVRTARDIYLRGISLVFLLLGLMQWAIILGVFPNSDWRFEAMNTQWQLTTMNMAVADLVASVGLWMRVAWGNVIWIYAALFQIVIHTIFIGTFGFALLTVMFHVATIFAFAFLWATEYRLSHES